MCGGGPTPPGPLCPTGAGSLFAGTAGAITVEHCGEVLLGEGGGCVADELARLAHSPIAYHPTLDALHGGCSCCGGGYASFPFWAPLDAVTWCPPRHRAAGGSSSSSGLETSFQVMCSQNCLEKSGVPILPASLSQIPCLMLQPRACSSSVFQEKSCHPVSLIFFFLPSPGMTPFPPIPSPFLHAKFLLCFRTFA